GVGQAPPCAALQLRYQRHALPPGIPSLRHGPGFRPVHHRRFRHAVGRGRAPSQDDVNRPALAHDRPPWPHRSARPDRRAHEAERRRLVPNPPADRGALAEEVWLATPALSDNSYDFFGRMIFTVDVAWTINRPFSSRKSPSRKPTEPPQRITWPSA